LEGEEGIMVLTSITTSSTTMDGTEKTLFSDSGETFQYNMVYIYLDAMTNTTPDVIVLKVYIWDNQASSLTKTYLTKTFTGLQPDAVFYLPPLPTHRMKVTLQQTAGTNRTINWERLSN
jgi:hypothetical protein